MGPIFGNPSFRMGSLSLVRRSMRCTRNWGTLVRLSAQLPLFWLTTNAVSVKRRPSWTGSPGLRRSCGQRSQPYKLALKLIHSCVQPRITHLARAGYSPSLLELSRRFDDRIREALRALSGVPVALSSESGDQLGLPLWGGGAGIRPVSHFLPAAAIGSWADAMPAVHRALGWYPLDPTHRVHGVSAQLAAAEDALTQQLALPRPWQS